MKLGAGPLKGLGPIPQGINVILVERRDKPGALGVAVRDGRFVCPLPEAYDGYTSAVLDSGFVLVTHPTLPPLMAFPETGRVEPMDASLLPANLVRAAIAGAA